MSYPRNPDIEKKAHEVIQYAKLMYEYGVSETTIEEALDVVAVYLKDATERLKSLEIDSNLLKDEPDALLDIRALRKPGPRRLWKSFDKKVYEDKLAGAVLSRFAGCTLGAPVEFWTVEQMEDWAAYNDIAFPPVDYWPEIKNPSDLRYGMSRFEDYTRSRMNGVPVDDDITYTILGLLIAEEYGLDFSVEDVGKAWLRYLPMACTAEHITLENLKKGVPAEKAGETDNPYCQWIGADIRSDPWAYMAPAWPEKAAELAWRDAFLSHRRNGIYGEMFFAAAQSAAFAVDTSREAIETGLTEIPKGCLLYKDITWALESSGNIHNYRDARRAVDERFSGMGGAHTNNNACLTVFGLLMAEGDVAGVISNLVAMGLDNDCTAATAGSIVGAIVGKDGVPKHWYAPFNDKVRTYMNGVPELSITDVLNRFGALAGKMWAEKNE
ncbi:MAG TPA: ADP-ribosylglycohydrolase family protein, partial [Clostridia bacterium]|nr:ADP-ribosylglycohydrolase family protein [Clostridia bacterium]